MSTIHPSGKSWALKQAPPPFDADMLQGKIASAYQNSYPGTKANVKVDFYPNGNVHYEVSWISLNAEEAAHRSIVLRKHPEGDLELYQETGYVNPKFRGLGHSAQICQVDTALVQDLSNHPDSRVTMVAEGMYIPQKRLYEKFGSGVWMRFGYDFAENHLGRFPQKKIMCLQEDFGLTPRPPDKAEPATVREGMKKWLQKKYLLGRISKKINNAIDALNQPWEFVQFKLGKIHGKDFLMSKYVPTWYGVYFVNQPDFPGRKISENYRSYAIAKGMATRTHRINAAFAVLESADESTPSADIEAAIEELKLLADASTSARLHQLASSKKFLSQSVKPLIDIVEEKNRTQLLQLRLESADVSPVEKGAILWYLTKEEGPKPLDAYLSVLNNEEDPMKIESLNLLDKHYGENKEFLAATANEVLASYFSMQGDDLHDKAVVSRWRLRREAYRVLFGCGEDASALQKRLQDPMEMNRTRTAFLEEV